MGTRDPKDSGQGGSRPESNEKVGSASVVLQVVKRETLEW